MNFDECKYNGTDSQCIDQITGLLYKIKDPVHLSNVHDWVIKLTTGEPSTLKTDYLRLLEYALKSDDGEGLQEPFTSPPLDRLLEDLERRSSPVDSVAASVGGNEWRTSAGGGCGGVDTSDVNLSPKAADRPPVASAALVDLLCRTDCETTSVQKFVVDTSPLTCDGSSLMSRVAGECLENFGRTAGAVFDERTQKLCDALAKEQVALLLRYRTNSQRMLTRAQILQDHVRELMPTFQYEEFLARPDEHVTKVLRAKKIGGTGNANEPEPDTAQATNGDGDDAAMQQKKLMCALQWLRAEVERADCENVTLVERYDAVVAAIVVASNKKIANECRAKARKLEVQAELSEVRKKSSKQEALIDCYIGKMSL